MSNQYTVAYVMNQRFFRCGSQYYSDIPNILDLAQAFGTYAGRVVVCAPTTAVDVPPAEADAIPDDLQVCELPFYASNLDLVLRSPLLGIRLLAKLWPEMAHWDVVGGDAPSGYGMTAVILAILRGKRGFFYVRGLLTVMLRGEHRDLTWKGRLIVGAFWPLDFIGRALSAAGVITLALGPELAERHRGPRVYLLRGYARPAVVGTEPIPPLADSALLRRIAFVGRLSGEKGAHVLLDAVSRLRHRGEDVLLTVTGDGPEMSTLRALARRLRIEDRVTFTGKIADPALLRAQFLAAGIVVVPSRTDGVPVVMLEAMALGRAVIATRVGGTPSVASDGQNGLLVEPDDPEGIADAIARLLHDPDLAFRLAQGATATGRERNLDAQAEQMMLAVTKGLRVTRRGPPV